MRVKATVYERMLWPGGPRKQYSFDIMKDAIDFAHWRKDVWRGSIALRVVRRDTSQVVYQH